VQWTAAETDTPSHGSPVMLVVRFPISSTIVRSPGGTRYRRSNCHRIKHMGPGQLMVVFGCLVVGWQIIVTIIIDKYSRKFKKMNQVYSSICIGT